MRVNDTISLEDDVTVKADKIHVEVGDGWQHINTTLDDIGFFDGGGDITIKAGDVFNAGFGGVSIMDGSGRARIEMEDGKIRIIGKEITLEPEPDEDGVGKVTVEPAEKSRGEFKIKTPGVPWVTTEPKEKEKEPPKSTDWFLKRTPHYHSVKEAKRKLQRFGVIDGDDIPIPGPKTTDDPMTLIGKAAAKDSGKFYRVAEQVKNAAKVKETKAEFSNPALAKALKTLGKYADALEEGGTLPNLADAIKSAKTTQEKTAEQRETRQQGSPDGASFWRWGKDENVGLRYNNAKRKGENRRAIEEAVNKYIDDVASSDENYRKLMADPLRRDAELRQIIKKFNHTRRSHSVTTKGLTELVVELNNTIDWPEPKKPEPEKIMVTKKGLWSRVRNRVGKWLSRKREE